MGFLKDVLVPGHITAKTEMFKYGPNKVNEMFKVAIATEDCARVGLVYAPQLSNILSVGQSVMLSNFRMEGGNLKITNMTSVMKTSYIAYNEDLAKTAEAKLDVVLKATSVSIKDARLSPKKSRVNLHGKVTKLFKVHTLKDRTKILSLMLRDKSGESVRCSLWRNLADSSLEVGNTIKLSNMQVSMWDRKPNMNSSAQTIIEFCAESMSDVNTDDDDNVEDSSGTTQGSESLDTCIMAISITGCYSACINPKCFYKKLDADFKCPSCQVRFSSKCLTYGFYGSIVITKPHFKRFAIFTSSLKDLFNQEYPGATIPSTAHELENALVEKLPIAVKLAVNSVSQTVSKIL